MAACDFNMRFVRIHAGWEGCATDPTVFDHAVTKGFIIPEGYFYLADAGYTSHADMMVPYRGVRYHLCEQYRALNV
jgi:hypothetical protein